MASRRLIRSADRLGLFVALGCGVHCAGLTTAFLIWPALWLNRGLWDSGLWHWLRLVELALLILAWALVAFASWFALTRHRRLHPVIIGLAGAVTLTAAILTPLHFASPWVSALSLIGGLTLAVAHGLNLRLYRRLHRGRA